jgi:putative tricarboxylic transport membrane protein
MKKILIIVLVFSVLIGTGLFANGQTEQGSGGAASAPEYPTKAIQVVVPAGAGGDTDLNSRILAKYLEKELGESVIIVNTGGAGGTLGSRKVKDSKADGYTVLFYHPSMLLNKLLGLVDYSAEDFANAGLAVLDQTNVFVTSAESPYDNIADVAKILKANPRSLSFATEVGAFTHLQSMAFQEAAGVELNIVDVGGAAAKTAALKGRQIDIIGTQYGLVKDFIANGDFKALGVLSEKRNESFPDVPTFKEQGFDISFTKFFFYSFPAGTPQYAIDTFTQALKRVVANPEYVAEAKKALLVTPTYMDPAEAMKFIKGEEAKFNVYKDKILAAKK